MGRITSISVVLFLVVAISFVPSPAYTLPTELLETVNGLATGVNAVLKKIINFPFTPQSLRDKLQPISTAIDNRDFLAAVEGIRNLIASKLRFIANLLDKSKLGELQREMEKVNRAVRNITDVISDGLDEEIEKMDPIMISSLSPELADKVRLIIEKIRNATIRAENFRLTPNLVKSALRRIRESLNTDNVLRIIQVVRNIAKSSLRSVLTSDRGIEDDLAIEIDEIQFEAMALQMRAEQAVMLRNSADCLFQNKASVAILFTSVYSIYKLTYL